MRRNIAGRNHVAKCYLCDIQDKFVLLQQKLLGHDQQTHIVADDPNDEDVDGFRYLGANREKSTVKPTLNI